MADEAPIDDNEGPNITPPEDITPSPHDTNSRRIINLAENDNSPADDNMPYRILNLAGDG